MIFGMFYNHLGNEGPSLEIAATFEFEEITLGADDRTSIQALEQATFRRLLCRH